MTFLTLGRHFTDLFLRTGHPNFFYSCAPKAAMFAPLLKHASAHWFAKPPKLPLPFDRIKAWPTPRGQQCIPAAKPIPQEEFPLPLPQLQHRCSNTPWKSVPVLRNLCSRRPRQDRASVSHPSSSTHNSCKPCSGSAGHRYKCIWCFRCHMHTCWALNQTPPLRLS